MRLLHEPVTEIFNMTGRIFDIQRFSTHDGMGIRTTIFLKGCPLSCVWCQNPEGISFKKRPLYFKNRCIGCGICIKKSQYGGLKKRDEHITLNIDAEEDWEDLIDRCPAGALEMDSREYELEEVMQEIRKDMVFYNHGGGITLSGGEALFQWEFALEILKQCKKEGIHTAMETSLYADQEVLKRVFPYLDMIFADFKIADDRKHKKYTDVSNQKIKENLKYLLQSEKKENVIIRTPMIPGMTAFKENVLEISRYISGIYPEVSYEILNYNPLAESKYHLIDQEFCFKENPKLYSKEQMQEFKNWALEGGVNHVIIES